MSTEPTVTPSDVMGAIRVLKSEFICCAAEDYEPGCMSCEALRIADILTDLLKDGHYKYEGDNGEGLL